MKPKFNNNSYALIIATYALIIAGLSGTSVYLARTNPSQKSAIQTQTQPQSQAPHGLSLQKLIKENGGAQELIGIDKDEKRRKDFDGDGVYDLCQVCSNEKSFFLSSIALADNEEECWYEVQGGKK